MAGNTDVQMSFLYGVTGLCLASVLGPVAQWLPASCLASGAVLYHDKALRRAGLCRSRSPIPCRITIAEGCIVATTECMFTARLLCDLPRACR